MDSRFRVMEWDLFREFFRFVSWGLLGLGLALPRPVVRHCILAPKLLVLVLGLVLV